MIEPISYKFKQKIPSISTDLIEFVCLIDGIFGNQKVQLTSVMCQIILIRHLYVWIPANNKLKLEYMKSISSD
jgi:hypothetical protein